MPAGAGGRVQRAVLAYLRRLEKTNPHATLLVACSGGPDSLALAAACSHLASSRNFHLVGVTVDHGWRKESSLQARQVCQILKELGYADIALLELSAQENGSGKEGAARKARYLALEKQARYYGKIGSEGFILLGHTRDDQAETVILGLLRGRGAHSI